MPLEVSGPTTVSPAEQVRHEWGRTNGGRAGGEGWESDRSCAESCVMSSCRERIIGPELSEQPVLTGDDRGQDVAGRAQQIRHIRGGQRVEHR